METLSDSLPAVKAKAIGYVLWEGQSLSDRQPIACVATGLKRTRNPKTGKMIQTFLFRQDINPCHAVKSGDDSSICNNCPLRQYTVKRLAERLGLKHGHRPPMCYVTTHFSVRNVWYWWGHGSYSLLPRNQYQEIFTGRYWRGGSYGNMSNSPLWIIEEITRWVRGWTLYEHNWRTKRGIFLLPFAMASVQSPQERDEAKALGFRTFRVRRPGEPVLKGEMLCPASEEAGKKSNCQNCGLCCGMAKPKRPDVTILDHGPTSQNHTIKVHGKRWSIQ